MTTWYHHPTPNTSTGSCPTRINSLAGSKIRITWQRWTTTKTLFYVKLMILFALICNREPTATCRLFYLESSHTHAPARSDHYEYERDSSWHAPHRDARAFSCSGSATGSVLYGALLRLSGERSVVAPPVLYICNRAAFGSLFAAGHSARTRQFLAC